MLLILGPWYPDFFFLNHQSSCLMLSPSHPPTETCVEPVQATLVEDMAWLNFTSIPTELIRIPSFCRSCVFTFEGKHDFLFLHLTTFKARFLHLRLELFSHLWLKEFLQLRVIFTKEADVFTFVVDFFKFVVDFYTLKFFYISGCNRGA